MKRVYKVIAFAISVIVLIFTIVNFEKKYPGEIFKYFDSREVPTHLWFYLLQFLALGIMHILYEERLKNRITTVTNKQKILLDKFKVPSRIAYRIELIDDASGRLMSCNTMINVLILIWVFFYTFLFFKEFGLINDFFDYFQLTSPDAFVNSTIRIFNYLDSIVILVLAIYFSAPSDLASVELSFNYRPLLFSSIILIVILDILSTLVFSLGSTVELWLTIVGAILSSLCFLLFFARLDSVFLGLKKPYIIVLFLYAIFQMFYPFEMVNWNGIRGMIEIDNVILYFGSFIKFIGKILIAYLICSKTFQDRMLVYFCCIFNVVNKDRY